MKKVRLFLMMLMVAMLPLAMQAQQALPYSYGFEDNDLSTNGWTIVNGASGYSGGTGISTSSAMNGTYGFMFYYSTNPPQYLISPELTGTESGVELEFYYRCYMDYYDETFMVGYSTTDNQTSSFTWGEEILAPEEWTLYSDMFPAGTKYIAIAYTANNQYYLFLDDFSFAAPASCAKPTNVTATGITTTSAIIGWTDNNSTTPSSWTIDVNGTEITNVTENPYTIENLTAATEYTVKVKAACTVDDTSDWSNSITFATECEIINVTGATPYQESFDGVTFPPTCWTVAHTAGTSSSTWIRNTTMAHTGNGCAQLEDQQTGNKNNLVTGHLNIPEANAYQVNFWVYRSSNYSSKQNEGVKVWINTTPDTVGATEIMYIHRVYSLTPAESATGWYPYTASIPTSGDLYVIFEGISEWGASTYIDDISVEIIPSCLAPTALTLDANSVTAYEATIGWMDNNNTTPENGWVLLVNDEEVPADANPFTLTNLTPETEYTVRVKAACSATDSSAWSNGSVSFMTLPSCLAPTALTVVENSVTATSAQISWTAGGEEEAWIISWNDTEITVTENPYTLENLTPATIYTVEVAASCSETDTSHWSNTVSFITECVTVVVTEENSFRENFNGITAGIPLCWNNEDGTTTNSYQKWSYNANGYTGACVRFNSYSNTNGNTNMLKTPGLNITALATPRVTFMYKNPTGGDFSVFVSTDGGETYTTELATGLTGATNWTPMAIALDGLEATDNVVVVFQGTSNYGNGDAYIYLDNVVVEETPACLAPTDLRLDTVTTTYFQISWDDNNDATPASWTMAYQVEGTEEFIEVPGVNTDSAYVFNFDAPMGDMNITVKVKANCDAEAESAWSDEINFVTPPTCPRPTALATDGITTNSVTLEWTAGGEETQWILSINGVETEIVTENPITIDTLTEETNYTIRVRAYCGEADSSVWTNSVSFYTGLCTPAPTSVDNSGITNVTFGQTQVVNNSTHPSSQPYYGDYTAQVGDGAASTNVTVDITYATGWTYGTVIWVNWNNDVEFTDDEVVFAGTSESTNPTTLSCTFNIPLNTPVGEYRMRIGGADSQFDNAISNGSGYNPCLNTTYTIYEDYTLSVTEAPSCIVPTDMTISGITTTTATIAWTDNNATAPQSWTIELNGVETNVTENPFTFDNLTSATEYTVKVKANCTADDESAWSEEETFTTDCDVIVVTSATPYQEGFENDALCWRIEQIEGTEGWYTLVSTSSVEGSAMAVCHYDPNSQSRLTSPTFDLTQLTTPYLTFYHHQASYQNIVDDLRVYYRTSATEEWTLLAEYTTAYPDWTEETFVLPNPSATYQISFVGAGNDGNYIWLDDVNVMDAPTCFAPTVLTIDAVSATSATIGWTDNNETAPQSWTINLNGVDTTVTTNPFTFDNLTAATAYTVKVKANCTDDDESNWSAESTFTTACDVVVVTDATPYNEGFESADNCWTDEDNYWTYGTNYNYTAHQGASYVYFSGNSFTVYTGKLVSPIFDITGVTTPYLSFAHAQKAWDSDQNILRVFYRASASEEWTLLVDYTSDITDWQEEEIALPNPSATYQIAFEGEAHYGRPVAVDAVRIFNNGEEPCATPTNVTVENGVVTWTGDAANYNVVIAVGEDTVVNTTVATNSYTIEGLNDGDHATVTVQAVCSEDDLSEWSEAVEFDYTVGVNNYSIKANIYPNPTTGNVTVESNAINADINVYDMFGKLMMTSKVASERTELNFSSFAPGVYMVRIANTTGTTNIKVVKE